MEDVLLDPSLKWWMIVPISVAMVIVGVLRSLVSFLLALKPKTVPFRTARERYVCFTLCGIFTN